MLTSVTTEFCRVFNIGAGCADNSDVIEVMADGETTSWFEGNDWPDRNTTRPRRGRDLVRCILRMAARMAALLEAARMVALLEAAQ